MSDQIKGPFLVMNSHIEGGKTIIFSRNDHGDQGVDFLADIPPFIGNERVANLFGAAPELLEACRSMLALAQTAELVRNISGDGKEGWAVNQIGLVKTLKQAQDAITKATT